MMGSTSRALCQVVAVLPCRGGGGWCGQFLEPVYRLPCGFDVNAAFHFASTPATGARIVGIYGKRCARLATDRRIATRIEGQQWDAELLAGVPHIACAPFRQWGKLQ